MLTRRQFIRRASLAASVVLGMPKLAKAWGIMPVIPSAVGGSWVNWDETTETGWGDYICLFENPIAGGNEIGQGFNLSESARVLVEYGAAPGIPGATGSPPSRLLDGTSDWFFTNDTWFNPLFAGQSEYFLCIKMNVGAGYDNGDRFVHFKDTGVEIEMMLDTDKLKVTLNDGDTAVETISSTDNITTGSIIYLCLFCDGVTSYAGWTVGTKPTKLTDFTAGKLITFTRLFKNFSILDSPTESSFFADASGTSRWMPGSVYFLVASNTCLITT